MASPIKKAIQDILGQLQQITDGYNTPAFQQLSVYNNQLQRLKDGSGYTFPLPAAFVELAPAAYDELGIGVSTADLTFRIRICHEQLDATDGTMDQDLDVFDLRDLVKVALTMYKPTNCSYLFSSGEDEDHDHGSVYELVTNFSCSFLDTKGSPLDPDSTRLVSKQPPITLEVNKED